jgi:hypothetical protein
MVAGKTLAAFAGPFASTSVSYYWRNGQCSLRIKSRLAGSFERQFLSREMTLAV